MNFMFWKAPCFLWRPLQDPESPHIYGGRQIRNIGNTEFLIKTHS